MILMMFLQFLCSMIPKLFHLKELIEQIHPPKNVGDVDDNEDSSSFGSTISLHKIIEDTTAGAKIMKSAIVVNPYDQKPAAQVKVLWMLGRKGDTSVDFSTSEEFEENAWTGSNDDAPLTN